MGERIKIRAEEVFLFLTLRIFVIFLVSDCGMASYFVLPWFGVSSSSSSQSSEDSSVESHGCTPVVFNAVAPCPPSPLS